MENGAANLGFRHAYYTPFLNIRQYEKRGKGYKFGRIRVESSRKRPLPTVEMPVGSAPVNAVILNKWLVNKKKFLTKAGKCGILTVEIDKSTIEQMSTGMKGVRI